MPQWIKVAWAVMFLAVTTAVGGTWAVYTLGRFYSDWPVPRSGHTQEQHEAGTHQEHGEGQKPQGDTDNGATTLHPQPPKHDGISSQPEQERHGYASPDWWIAGFTGALFVATSGLWFVTGKMWGVTKRAVLDGEKAIIAANRHADVSTDMVQVMKDTAV